MSFRKEKKYRLSYSDMLLIKRFLLNSNMTELFPKRVVNSCYFENNKFESFHDSEEGVLPRKKVRVRWYSQRLLDDSEKKFSCSKEVKISSVEGRYKIVDKFNSLMNIDDVSELNFFDNIYGNLTPVLIVSYEREYYGLKKLRITFDRNITYKYQRKSNYSNQLIDNECVMEVKVPIDCDDDYIEKIISHPTSRFSKYSRGMLIHNAQSY